MTDNNIIRLTRDEANNLIAIDNDNRDRIKNVFACSHINIILGSGFCIDVIPSLGEREHWLTKLDQTSEVPDFQNNWKQMEGLLIAEYYQSILSPAVTAQPSDHQKSFLHEVRRIIQARGNTTIPKRANIFTTNYDPIIELGLENEKCAYNDGFEGRMKPVFLTHTFSKLHYSQSLSMEYSSQVPTINLIKIHGSLTWKAADEEPDSIEYCDYEKEIAAFSNTYSGLLESEHMQDVSALICNAPTDEHFDSLKEIANSLSGQAKDELASFLKEYKDSFCIINPTKKKFEETVLGLTYYELLRLYANELDRNNSLLFSFGFSFEDEHIREITLRALENPQLILLISCHNDNSLQRYQEMFSEYSNVWYLSCENGFNIGEACDFLNTMR